MEHCLQILVDNKPGVLARVAIQLARRSINIDCLAARNMEGGTRTVITVGFDADEYTADRLAKGIVRLIDVIEVRSPGSNATRRPQPAELPQCLLDDWGKPWRSTDRLGAKRSNDREPQRVEVNHQPTGRPPCTSD